MSRTKWISENTSLAGVLLLVPDSRHGSTDSRAMQSSMQGLQPSGGIITRQSKYRLQEPLTGSASESDRPVGKEPTDSRSCRSEHQRLDRVQATVDLQRSHLLLGLSLQRRD